MQRKKSRAELISTPYLNIAEVAVLLDIPRTVARKIYEKSQLIDKEQLGDFWIYENKVRTKIAVKVGGYTLPELERQIKNADALTQQSANQ